MTAPRVAVGPVPRDSASQAIRDGGGVPAGVDASADALVWLDPSDIEGLRGALAAAAGARWVQLPFAGIERVADAGLLDPNRRCTSAKGAYDESVTILGAGGITASLLELLAPFRSPVTVVRRRLDAVPGAARTLPQSALHEALAGARVVFVALALTPSTERIIGPAELAVMRGDS